MTRESAISKLRSLQHDTPDGHVAGDPEAEHQTADAVLCDLLRALGYGDVVDEWEKVDKWYA